jgi:hypothetical protein
VISYNAVAVSGDNPDLPKQNGTPQHRITSTAVTRRDPQQNLWLPSSDDNYVVFIATTDCDSKEIRYTSKMAKLLLEEWPEEDEGGVNLMEDDRDIMEDHEPPSAYRRVVSDLDLHASPMFSPQSVRRQIRAETRDLARDFPYKQTAFGFFDPEALARFVATTSAPQRCAVTQNCFPDLEKFTKLQRAPGLKRDDFPAASKLEALFPNLKKIYLPASSAYPDSFRTRMFWDFSKPLNTEIRSTRRSRLHELNIWLRNIGRGMAEHGEGYMIEEIGMDGVGEAFENLDRVVCQKLR